MGGNKKIKLLFSIIAGLCFAAVFAVVYLIVAFALHKFSVTFLVLLSAVGFIIGVVSDRLAYFLEKDRIVKAFEATGKIEITEGYTQNYIAQAKRDLQKFPEYNAALYLSLAFAYIVNGDVVSAAELLDTVGKDRFLQSPEGAQWYYSVLVHLYEIQGEKDKLKETYKEGMSYITEAYTREPQARLAQAIYEMTCENYDKSIDILSRKITSSSIPAQQFAVICAYYKALCLMKTGRITEADSVLSECMDNASTEFYKHRLTELFNILREMKTNETIS